jgi:hypothetical protein
MFTICACPAKAKKINKTDVRKLRFISVVKLKKPAIKNDQDLARQIKSN